MNDPISHPEQSPLGKASSYVDRYDPALLFPLPRLTKRTEISSSPSPRVHTG